MFSVVSHEDVSQSTEKVRQRFFSVGSGVAQVAHFGAADEPHRHRRIGLKENGGIALDELRAADANAFPEEAPRGTVGIPRALNQYENYPFWFKTTSSIESKTFASMSVRR